MLKLSLHKTPITSFYQLLGTKENDMTYGLGYVFSRSPTFLKQYLEYSSLNADDIEYCEIKLQTHHEDGGFTDIEIWKKEKRFLIIEAKKSWILPSEIQLEKYIQRFTNKDFNPSVQVLSECTYEYATRSLTSTYRYIAWNTILELLDSSYYDASSTIEKNHINEYFIYLKGILGMERIQSNLVYNVSLSNKTVPGSEVSFFDIVDKYNKYFFPFMHGSGRPTEAPNYISFRYKGQLKSIHKVERFYIHETLHESMPDVIQNTDPDLHFFLHLGPAIIPQRTVKNGNIWPNGRFWCMIDTLLTCNTIEEAIYITKCRLNGEGYGENIYGFSEDKGTV